MEFQKEERVTAAEKRIKSERHLKFNEEHQLTNPKRSVNIKQDKCKKNHTYAHPNQISGKAKVKRKYSEQPLQNDTLLRET